MTVNDIPLISFSQRVLDPLIIMGTLYLFAMVFGEPFTGYLLVLMILAFFISSAVYQHIDAYHAWRNGRMRDYVRNILLGWGITVAIFIFLGSASGLAFLYNERMLLAWFIATPCLVLVSHFAACKIASDPIRGNEVRSAVIVGANDVGLKFADTILRHPNLFMSVRGFFDDRGEDRRPAAMREPMLGRMDDIVAFVRKENIKLIFISQPISAQPRIRKLLDELQDTTASVYFLPNIYTFDLMQARFNNVAGMPAVAICETPFTGMNGIIKRGSDIVIAALLLVSLSPLMLAVALAVKLTSPGPVIFRQRRYGLYGEEIIVYKFRSMTVCDDGPNIVQARKNDRRVTPLGAFLRRSSLDEMPQIINVLQGRMSIVGPRPHAVAHNEEYRKVIKGYMLRHKVRPGITGWAQVNGMRGETDTIEKMEGRIECDLDYLRRWSLWLDICIIFRTVKVVLGRDNAH